LAYGGHPYIYSGGQFVLANTITLAQIAVGGGNLRQADTVWALDAGGNIYNAAKSGTTWVFNRMPGSLNFIAVGIGYQDKCHPYEVWGLNLSSLIYRFNYCLNNWEYIPGTLQTLAVGGNGVWGINASHHAYFFWFDYSIFVDETPTGVLFDKVTVGPDGTYLRSTLNALYQSTTVNDFPEVATGGAFSDIEAGGEGVWGVDLYSGHPYLLQNARQKFIQIPGVFSAISVGSGAGVWAIDNAGQVYVFSRP